MLFWCWWLLFRLLGACIWFGVKMSQPTGDSSVASGSGSGGSNDKQKQTNRKVGIRNTKIGASGRVCTVHGCHNHDSSLKRWLNLLYQEHDG